MAPDPVSGPEEDGDLGFGLFARRVDLEFPVAVVFLFSYNETKCRTATINLHKPFSKSCFTRYKTRNQRVVCAKNSGRCLERLPSKAYNSFKGPSLYGCRQEHLDVGCSISECTMNYFSLGK